MLVFTKHKISLPIVHWGITNLTAFEIILGIEHSMALLGLIIALACLLISGLLDGGDCNVTNN